MLRLDAAAIRQDIRTNLLFFILLAAIGAFTLTAVGTLLLVLPFLALIGLSVRWTVRGWIKRQ